LASFVDTTVKDIDDRLSELKQEVAKLEAARTALLGSRRGPGRPPGSTTRTRTGRTSTRRRTGARRGRRGGNTRANQALELVRSQPGITIPDIAQAMGIAPNYLYRVLPRLAKEGQLRKTGNGWHAAS
jgi:CRP-like cAMP-binding protein